MGRDLEAVANRLEAAGWEVERNPERGSWFAYRDGVAVSRLDERIWVNGVSDAEARRRWRAHGKAFSILDALDGKPAPETPEQAYQRGLREGRAAALREVRAVLAHGDLHAECSDCAGRLNALTAEEAGRG